MQKRMLKLNLLPISGRGSEEMVALRQLVRVLQREGLNVRDQGRHGWNPEQAIFRPGSRWPFQCNFFWGTLKFCVPKGQSGPSSGRSIQFLPAAKQRRSTNGKFHLLLRQVAKEGLQMTFSHLFMDGLWLILEIGPQRLRIKGHKGHIGQA